MSQGKEWLLNQRSAKIPIIMIVNLNKSAIGNFFIPLHWLHKYSNKYKLKIWHSNNHLCKWHDRICSMLYYYS